MGTFKKEYINEEKAKELFEEWYNNTVTEKPVKIYCETVFNNTPAQVIREYNKEMYEGIFIIWLHTNDYHCQVQEYDKYED